MGSVSVGEACGRVCSVCVLWSPFHCVPLLGCDVSLGCPAGWRVHVDGGGCYFLGPRAVFGSLLLGDSGNRLITLGMMSSLWLGGRIFVRFCMVCSSCGGCGCHNSVELTGCAHLERIVLM